MLRISFLLPFLLIGCNSIKYIVSSEYSLVVEAPNSLVSAHCSPRDKDQNNSFTYLYLMGKKRIDTLIFRRPWSYENCLQRKALITKVIMSDSKVKVFAGNLISRKIGVHEDKDDLGFKPPDSKTTVIYSWIFDRIETKSKCHSYFTHSCQENHNTLKPDISRGRGF